MILGLQITALIFALIMIYVAYAHYRKGEISSIEILSWFVIWIGAILLILFPDLFSVFAKTVAISRAFDLGVLGGFILIIPLVYVTYVKSKKIERKLEEYIRKESINEFSKNKIKIKK